MSTSPARGWEAVPELIASIAQPCIPATTFDIRDHAKDDELAQDCRPAIERALRCAADGSGGRIIIPPGTWYCGGPIHLRSHCELHLMEGAVLRFSPHPEDYLPQVLTRWEGTECFNYSPLIYAYMAEDVAITGSGTIDGNATDGFGDWRPQQNPGKKRLRQMGAEGTPVFQRVFGDGDFLRPSMIQFLSCTRTCVEGVRIIDSPFWVIHLVSSAHCQVRKVQVDSQRLNNDGVDVESCSSVLIEDNHFITGDDSIVIKSGRDADGWRLGRPSQDIVIRNNTMTGHNALAIGSEMSGGVRRVYMQDNRLLDVRGALYFKGNPDRGGTIEDVWMRRIQVDRCEKPLIQFRSNYQGVEQGPYPPRFHHITIEDVQVEHCGQLLHLNGTQQQPIDTIVIARVHAKQSWLHGDALEQALVVDCQRCHVRNLRLEDVSLQGHAIQVLPAAT